MKLAKYLRIIAVITIAFTFKLSAQITYTYGEEYKMKSRISDFFQLTDGSLYSFNDAGGYSKKKFKLFKYDGLSPVLEKEFEFANSRAERRVMTVFQLGDKLYAMLMESTAEKRSRQIVEIDPKTLELRSNIELKDEAKYNEHVVHRRDLPIFNKESSFFGLRELNNSGLNIQVYNSKFEKQYFLDLESIITSKDISVVQEWFNDRNELILVIKEAALFEQGDIWVLKVTSSGVVTKQKIILGENKKTPIVRLSKEGDVYLCGLMFAEIKLKMWQTSTIGETIDASTGYYLMHLDSNLNEVSNDEVEYNDDIMLEGYVDKVKRKSERKIAHGKDLAYGMLKLRNFYVLDEGFYLVFEERSQTELKDSEGNISYLYYSGPVTVFKLNSEGEFDWYKKIFKAQYFNGISGIKLRLIKNDLIMVYNDYYMNLKFEDQKGTEDFDETGTGSMFLVNIDPNGQMSKQRIDAKDLKKNLVNLSYNSHFTDDGMILYTANGIKMRLLDVNFK